jgi:isoleucyl-tRNA synthetase
MSQNLVDRPDFDPHRPYVDEIILKAPDGSPMYREQVVIDVWFDSGAMPYANGTTPLKIKTASAANFPRTSSQRA